MKSSHFRQNIVRPALEKIGLWSEVAEELLMGTAAQESLLGHFLVQMRGPARGVYQCEPATEHDIWQNYLIYRPQHMQKLNQFGICWEPDDDSIIWNLAYATAMCRFHYLRIDEALPTDSEDIPALADYWKRHYNTRLGQGTTKEFIDRYNKYVRS